MSNTWRQNITMNGTGAQPLTIPSGMNYMTIQNNTDNTIHIYDDIRTVNDADLRDVLTVCAPYTAITVPLNTKSTSLTVIFITGGGAGNKVAQLMVSTDNLNINTQMGNPGTNQNVAITTDQIGLAKQAQLPAALTGLGNLKVEVQNTVPISVAGSVEVSNDTGNPLPVSGTVSVSAVGGTVTITGSQLASIITLLTDLNSKIDTANAHLAAIETNTTPTP